MIRSLKEVMIPMEETTFCFDNAQTSASIITAIM